MILYAIYDTMAGYTQFLTFANDDVAKRNFAIMMKDVPKEISACCELHCLGPVDELTPESILIEVPCVEEE